MYRNSQKINSIIKTGLWNKTTITNQKEIKGPKEKTRANIKERKNKKRKYWRATEHYKLSHRLWRSFEFTMPPFLGSPIVRSRNMTRVLRARNGAVWGRLRRPFLHGNKWKMDESGFRRLHRRENRRVHSIKGPTASFLRTGTWLWLRLRLRLRLLLRNVVYGFGHWEKRWWGQWLAVTEFPTLPLSPCWTLGFPITVITSHMARAL